MQIIYPDLNEQKKPQKPTPYSTDSQSVLHYWVRQEKGAWLNEKAWNPVLPKCSFVASVYFFFSTTPQTKICLLCVLKCATKIHMQHCPHYYSFLSWRWRQKLFFFFPYGKKQQHSAFTNRSFTQTNALSLWQCFQSFSYDLHKIIIAAYLCYLGPALTVASVWQHERNCWLIAQEFAQNPRKTLHPLLSPTVLVCFLVN